ncbi:MAG: PDC sensor domain-containing protein [Gammaproteobacteria bacterium]|nr:PDC sensor domain-containing protein [Gammaproteobacteria bacterium]
MSWFKEIISNKKKTLAKRSEGFLTALAKSCVYAWDNPDELDKILQDSLNMLPYCQLIYAVNTDGTLISSNIEAHKKDETLRGRDLGSRPYMESNLPFKGFTMSPVYISTHTGKSCITVMQAVTDKDKVLGFIAADFDVEKLPVDKEIKPTETKWQQFKGDPAIRGTLFMQERVQSAMDKRLDEVTEIIKEMMQHHGIFHCKIHYSSSRVSFWTMENPYDYHIHLLDDLIDPERCLAYPLQDYPEIATVPQKEIAQVVDMFKELRNMDETVYLRSASFNIVNGMIGLTFSCDGSHYMKYDEFLKWDMKKWFGSSGDGSEQATS